MSLEEAQVYRYLTKKSVVASYIASPAFMYDTVVTEHGKWIQYFFTYLTIFLVVRRNLPVHIISAIDVPTSICGILLALIPTSVSLQTLLDMGSL